MQLPSQLNCGYSPISNTDFVHHRLKLIKGKTKIEFSTHNYLPQEISTLTYQSDGVELTYINFSLFNLHSDLSLFNMVELNLYWSYLK